MTKRRPRSASTARLVILTTLAVGVGAWCVTGPADPAATPARSSPVELRSALSRATGLRGARLWSDPSTAARRAAQAHSIGSAGGDTALLAKVAGQPQSVWVTSGTRAVAARVAAVVDRAAGAGAVPVITLYALPHLDCGDAGTSSAARYRAWIRQVVDGLAGRPAALILEPDALAMLNCLSPGDRAERLALLRDAVSTLGRDPAAIVYLDAGHSQWVGSGTMARRLAAAGIAEARGFSLNVSNFRATRDEIAYGHRISAKLGRPTHFVVDTGRNGRGPAADAAWCNPQGRALGERPTTNVPDPLVDALLWIKPPGESDGRCGRTAPAAGVFWPEYAKALAARAAW